MAHFALVESPKLISRKIWVMEKSWNFYIVCLVCLTIHESEPSKGFLKDFTLLNIFGVIKKLQVGEADGKKRFVWLSFYPQNWYLHSFSLLTASKARSAMPHTKIQIVKENFTRLMAKRYGFCTSAPFWKKQKTKHIKWLKVI